MTVKYNAWMIEGARGLSLRDMAYSRANGHCECAARYCAHEGRCSGPLLGEWDILRLDPAQPLILNNVVAICEACSRHARGSAVGVLPGI